MKINFISLTKATGILVAIVGGGELRSGNQLDSIFGFIVLLLGMIVFYIFDAISREDGK